MWHCGGSHRRRYGLRCFCICGSGVAMTPLTAVLRLGSLLFHNRASRTRRFRWKDEPRRRLSSGTVHIARGHRLAAGTGSGLDCFPPFACFPLSGWHSNAHLLPVVSAFPLPPLPPLFPKTGNGDAAQPTTQHVKRRRVCKANLVALTTG